MTSHGRAVLLTRLLVSGTGIISFAYSITIPFLAVFLRRDLGLPPGEVGVVVGASVFFSIFAGFFGGALSDILGRTRVLVLALLGVAISFVGLFLSHSAVAVFACNASLALCTSSFTPVGKALLSDLLPPDRRVRWFSYQYIAYNIGFAVGPPVGAGLGLSGGRLSFLAASAVYGVYAALVAAVVLMARPDARLDRGAARSSGVRRGLGESLRVIASDRRLWWVLSAAVLLEAVHSRISVLLAQDLVINFAQGTQILAALLTTNAITVVVCQLFASRYVQKRDPIRSIVIGGLLLFTGMMGFAASRASWQFVAAMVLFTVGETFIIPSEFAIMDRLAPESRRGSYFGAQTFGQLGGFIGPLLGGLMLAAWGGPLAFVGVGSLALAGVAIYVVSGRRIPQLSTAAVQVRTGGADAVD